MATKKTKPAPKLPTFFERFRKEHPEVAAGYDGLVGASRKESGFAPKETELLKLALSIGARLEGAAHSHARRAVESGATPAELRGVALLAITTCGFPAAMAGRSWIEDVLVKEKRPRRK